MQKDVSRKEASDLLAGLDEVGMGCLAGPCVVAVVAFPRDFPKIEGVRDSKKLSRKKREELAPKILGAATCFGIGWAHPELVDQLGIAKAWQYAANMALAHLPTFGCLYVDGMRRVAAYSGRQIVEDHGKDKWWQVAAASIVAKVSRDHDMREMAKVYPGYDFEKHVGYGTKAHTRCILAKGPCPYHRRTFLKKLYRQSYETMWR